MKKLCILLLLTLVSCNNNSDEVIEYIDANHLVQSFYATFKKYNSLRNSQHVLENPSILNKNIDKKIKQTDKQIANLFENDTIYANIKKDYRFFGSQQFDPFLYTIQEANIVSIKKISYNSKEILIVNVNSKHIFYDNNTSYVLKYYNIKSINKISNAYLEEQNKLEGIYNNTFDKGVSIQINTHEVHIFEIETINKHKKIKSFQFHIISFTR